MNATQIKKIVGGINTRMTAMAGTSKISYHVMKVVVGDKSEVFDIRIGTQEYHFENVEKLLEHIGNIVDMKAGSLSLNQEVKDTIVRAIADQAIMALKLSLKEDVVRTPAMDESLKDYGDVDGELLIASYVTNGKSILDIPVIEEHASREQLEEFDNPYRETDAEFPKVKEVKDVEDVKEVKTPKQDINIEKSFAGFKFTRVKNDKENYIKLRSTNKLSSLIGGSVVGACAGLAVVGVVALAKAVLFSGSSPVAESTEEA